MFGFVAPYITIGLGVLKAESVVKLTVYLDIWGLWFAQQDHLKGRA